MGDRTSYTLTVAHATGLDDLQCAKIAEAFQQGDVGDVWRGTRGEDLQITVAERGLCQSPEAAHDVLGAMATYECVRAFEIVEDPVYEYLGHVVRWAPGLGLYEHPCDDAGQVVLSWAEIERQRKAAPGRDLLDLLREAYGVAWTDAMGGAA